jgi:hypothetical protein
MACCWGSPVCDIELIVHTVYIDTIVFFSFIVNIASVLQLYYYILPVYDIVH